VQIPFISINSKFIALNLGLLSLRNIYLHFRFYHPLKVDLSLQNNIETLCPQTERILVISSYIKVNKQKVQDTKMESRPSTDLPPIATEYNGKDRNAFLFGYNPQAELWNGRFAMIGFLAYLLWDVAGYSVLRDVLHLIGY
jgi:hypothetical protein